MSDRRLIPLKESSVSETTRRLVILIPGMGSAIEPWASLVARLQKEPGYRPEESHWMWFNHQIQPWSPGDIGPWFRRNPKQPGSLETLARQLRNQVQEQWVKHGKYQDVVLIGHSIGGLLARLLYLLAAGAVPQQPASRWGDNVSRIVLFAAVNRGFRLESLRWWQQMVAQLARGLSRRVFYFEEVVQGSDFVTNLRIDWIRHFRGMQDRAPGLMQGAHAGQSGVPLVVQFLGDEDELIDPQDNMDMLAFPNGQFIPVAGADHADLYRLDVAPDPDGRYAVLQEAFTGDSSTMSSDDSARPEESPIKRVVILLHGIRATNVDSWIRQLEGKIRESDPLETDVVTPTYGFFSALRFSLPLIRKRNIPLLRDYYTEELAKHPRAEFNIIAHSNGTYMLGHILKRTPGMRFRNVVLAGSALPQDYDWDDLMDPNTGGGTQVRRVLNELASHDFPVGILCSALRGLNLFGRKDIGTAGFAGFPGSSVRSVGYHKGGHSRALHPGNHKRLVDFVMGGNPPDPDRSELSERPLVFGFFSQAAPILVWVALVLIVLWFQGDIIPNYVFTSDGFNPMGAFWTLVGIAVTIIIADRF
jgi:triacylglycerol esterase/lipase EstA (alpha/beta hydrolase family)